MIDHTDMQSSRTRFTSCLWDNNAFLLKSFPTNNWEKALSIPVFTFFIKTARFSALSGGTPGPFPNLLQIDSLCPTDVSSHFFKSTAANASFSSLWKSSWFSLREDGIMFDLSFDDWRGGLKSRKDLGFLTFDGSD